MRDRRRQLSESRQALISFNCESCLDQFEIRLLQLFGGVRHPLLKRLVEMPDFHQKTILF